MEPLALEPNQKIRISIEPIGSADPASDEPPRKADFSRLLGLGLKGPTNPNPRFPDEDSLWEGTTGNYLDNGPNKPGQK